MRKFFVVLLLAVAVFSFTACGAAEDVAAVTPEPTPTPTPEPMPTPAPVLVYDSETVSVFYLGAEDDEFMPCLVFNVINKSEQNFAFAFDAIAVNGETEHPMFSVEILSGTECEYYCDVSTIEGIETLTAKMYTYDDDGYTIEEFKVKDVPLN